MPHLDPTSCWPSLAGPGSQLDPVGLQGSSLPPATHFVKGHTPRPPRPQMLQGLWGARPGRDVERSLDGWWLGRGP